MMEFGMAFRGQIRILKALRSLTEEMEVEGDSFTGTIPEKVVDNLMEEWSLLINTSMLMT